MTVQFSVSSDTARVDVTWHGDDLQRTIASQRANALFEGAKIIVDAARPNAPRRSRALRKSGYAQAAGGRSTYRGGRGRRKAPKLRPGTALAAFSQFYAGFQERGTRRHRAQPFLGPAVSAKKTQATAAAVKHLKRAAGL